MINLDISMSNMQLHRRALSLSRGRTSVNIEQYVWHAWDRMCEALETSPRMVAELIDQGRDPEVNFTNALRVAVLAYWLSAADQRRAAPSTHLSAALAAIGGAAA